MPILGSAKQESFLIIGLLALAVIGCGIFLGMLVANRPSDSTDVASDSASQPSVSADEPSDGSAVEAPSIEDEDEDDPQRDDAPADSDDAGTASADSLVEEVDVTVAVQAEVEQRSTVEVFGCGVAQQVPGTSVRNGLLLDAAPGLPLWHLEGIGRPRTAQVADLLFVTGVNSPQAEIAERSLTAAEEAGDTSVAVLGANGVAVAATLARDGSSLSIAPSPLEVAGVPARVRSLDGALLGLIGGDDGILDQSLATSTPSWGQCGGVQGALTPDQWSNAVAPDIASLLGFQRLATAFADGDWATVRQIEAAKAAYSDATFLTGWGNLDRSLVIPVRRLSNNSLGQRWRIALLGHETTSQRVTTLFCVEWEFSLRSGQVTQTGENALPIATLASPLGGWQDPDDLSTMIARC